MNEVVARDSSRQDRRKAATKAKISEAADRLFAERGYAETSMDDISEAADVGVRTIYLHFQSKPGILLDYFDTWLDAFVACILDRPTAEPVEDSLPAVMKELAQRGWPDGPFRQFPGEHTFNALIGDSPEVAGHLFLSWVRAQRRIAAGTAAQLGADGASREAELRAATIIAAWSASVTLANEGFADGSIDPTVAGNSLGAAVTRLLTRE